MNTAMEDPGDMHDIELRTSSDAAQADPEDIALDSPDSPANLSLLGNVDGLIKEYAPKAKKPCGGLGVMILIAMVVFTGFGILYFLQDPPPEESPIVADTAVDFVNSNARADKEADYASQMMTDRQGVWISVWYSLDDLDGTIGKDHDILFAKSTNNGVTWSDLGPLNTNAATDQGIDNAPQIATDGSGVWLAAWQSTEQLSNGTHNTGHDWDILFSVSLDQGESWQDPRPLNTNAFTDLVADMFVQITTDQSGTWIATWSSRQTAGVDDIWLQMYSVSRDNCVTWSVPSRLSETTTMLAYPMITMDKASHWMVVWAWNNGTYADIHVVVSQDRGDSWTTPRALNSNALVLGAGNDSPSIATDTEGTWIVVWESFDDFGGTLGIDSDILFSRSVDNGATWTPAAPVNTNAAVDFGLDMNAHITSNERGRWVVVWDSDDDLGGRIGSDDDILFAMTISGGATWSEVEPLNLNAAVDSGDDEYPTVSSDIYGSFLAVWESQDPSFGTGSDWDIFCSHFQPVEF